MIGPKGRVVSFIRSNGKCPAREFLSGCQTDLRFRFSGSFAALTQLGAQYHNQQRYKLLTGPGRPLWEFKEFDHRLFCHRKVRGEFVTAVLLNGWVKDKGGKSREEVREIERAQRLMAELLNAHGGIL